MKAMNQVKFGLYFGNKRQEMKCLVGHLPQGTTLNLPGISLYLRIRQLKAYIGFDQNLFLWKLLTVNALGEVQIENWQER